MTTTIQLLFIGRPSTVPSCWSPALPLKCPVKPTCHLPALGIAFSDDFPLLDPGQTLIPFRGMSKEDKLFMLPAQVHRLCLLDAYFSPCSSASLISWTCLFFLSCLGSLASSSSPQRSCLLPNLCLVLYLWDILKGTALKEISLSDRTLDHRLLWSAWEGPGNTRMEREGGILQ